MLFPLDPKNRFNSISGIIGAVVVFATTVSILVYSMSIIPKETFAETIPEGETVVQSVETSEVITPVNNTDEGEKPSNSKSQDYLYIISIPTAKIKAKVVGNGLTESGAMAVTSNPRLASWYKLGPRPGNMGSAVIAGHSGYSGGIASFEQLPKVDIGDIVYLEHKSGETLKFEVINTKRYAADSKVDDVFANNDGRFLNLITCVGSWNSNLGTHSERLVVYTKLADTR